MSSLEGVLRTAQAQGFLGSDPIADYIAHARAHGAFLTASKATPNDVAAGATANAADKANPAAPITTNCLDLGSGGGVPGLVVAFDFPTIAVTLLDRSTRRCNFLRSAIAELQLGETVRVVCAEAVDAAHDPEHRHYYDFILSRSFAQPAVTAECAAGLLRQGGKLIVSEPPEPKADRWPPAPLAGIGLELESTSSGEPHFAVLKAVHNCPPNRPRPWPQITKKPLY